MIRIGSTSFGVPDSWESTIELIETFSHWFSFKYHGAMASSTFAHIVLDDHNLDDDYIHWCVEWERVRSWLDDEMETIGQKCSITGTTGSIYTQIALREEALEKAQAIIRFLLDLTTIPEEHRIWYMEEERIV